MYMIQDANYNVVALCNSAGGLTDQYSYDPYGTVNANETFGQSHPVSRVGHQGLFFERYDGSYSDPSIAPNIAGLCQNRNRFYSPTLGRFITRDPNETGMPIVTAMAMNADSLGNIQVHVTPKLLYQDGPNLYSSFRCNPLSRRDPSGLFSLLELLGVQGISAEARAANAANAAVGAGYFAKVLDAINWRNQILDMVTEMAERIGGARGLDFLARAEQMMEGLSGRVFNSGNYRDQYGWLMGKLQANCTVHHVFPQAFRNWFVTRGINIDLPL